MIDGAFEIRWTWLPFWLATNPKLKQTLEGEMKAIVALNGIRNVDEDLEKMHRHVLRRITQLFPEMKGLDQFLDGMRDINPS